MRRVILESPYAGNVEANVRYARACVRDSLSRGEAPIASHLLYTQPGVLRDEDASERQWGIDAGLAWRTVAEATVVYTDRGISKGMAYGIEAAIRAGVPVEYRSIDDVDEITGPTCDVHGTTLTDDHLGPEGVLLCRACVADEHQHRKQRGYEDPADEPMRRALGLA